MSFDHHALSALLDRHPAVARVVVAQIKGSTPREEGAAMYVWRDGDGFGQSESIGGGALEFGAQANAQAMLEQNVLTPRVDHIPLGPHLGQCCGGSVSLVSEVFTRATLPRKTDVFARTVGIEPAPNRPMLNGPAPRLAKGWLVEAITAPRTPIWIWGGGHVGRALAAVLAPLPEFAVTLIDISPERLPNPAIENVNAVVAVDPSVLAPHADPDAQHFVMTHDHAIDLDICHALLGQQATIGLIGSATKWARFRKRLAALGHETAQISGITCPIGDPSVGKHPQAIAVSITAGLLQSQAQTATSHAVAAHG